MKKKLLLINGPNLNLLGQRETDLYGNLTLKSIEEDLQKKSQENGIELLAFQSNYEGAIIDFIHDNGDDGLGLIINPGAFTHTSIGIRDAILAKKISTVEVHLSNIYKREPFRHQSFIHDISDGIIIGMGSLGYFLALEYFIKQVGT